MPNVKAVPDGYHTINVTLAIKNAAEAIEWYKKAFGAKETMRALGPDGKSIMHAEMKLGDCTFMLNDEFPEMNCLSPQTIGNTPVSIWLYVENVDQMFDSATKNGAKALMPVADMFWGDRFGQIQDPYGHRWSIATHKEDVPPEEMKKRQEEFQKQMACAKK